MLDRYRVFDLTQPVSVRTPIWPDGERFSSTTITTIAADGDYSRRFCIDEHTGTHFDAPAHFVEGAQTVEAVPVERLVCTCVVIDISAQCAADPAYLLAGVDIDRFEAAHGPISAGSAVLVKTGWDRFIRDDRRYVTGMRFPGVGVEAARALVARGVVGIGIDTLSVDAGAASDFPVHHVTLAAGLWHVEGLTGLDQLPVTGAWVVVGATLLVGGSGAPARVMALAP